MEVSALRPPGLTALRGPTPLLRALSDERLVVLTRRGNQSAYEALVGRYESRLLAFCRHMLASKEDAEDVLQEVFAAAFSAMQADERPINVRPWLYRIARNRSLNHLRRQQAIGVDSMDVHLAEGGISTADKVHRREEFRALIGDVQELPESQRTALLLREIDALSYDQIAEAMETTVPSVKSLLVRARVSLAEMAEARRLTCSEVREELGEVAEGLRRTSAPVRRHLRTCDRCSAFQSHLRQTNKALAAIMPVGPLFFLKKFVLAQLGTTASAGGAAAGAGGAAVAGTAGAGAASTLGAGAAAIASKAAAGLAAAAIVTVGAAEVDHATTHRALPNHAPVALAQAPQTAAPAPVPARAPVAARPVVVAPAPDVPVPATATKVDDTAAAADKPITDDGAAEDTTTTTTATTTTPATTTPTTAATVTTTTSTQTVGDVTVLPGGQTTTTTTPTVQTGPSTAVPPTQTTPVKPAVPAPVPPAATTTPAPEPAPADDAGAQPDPAAAPADPAQP